MTASRRLDVVVRGRVQGVGYRFFVLRLASGLGLDGWVSNEADGSVRVRAEGPPGCPGRAAPRAARRAIRGARGRCGGPVGGCNAGHGAVRGPKSGASGRLTGMAASPARPTCDPIGGPERGPVGYSTRDHRPRQWTRWRPTLRPRSSQAYTAPSSIGSPNSRRPGIVRKPPVCAPRRPGRIRVPGTIALGANSRALFGAPPSRRRRSACSGVGRGVGRRGTSAAERGRRSHPSASRSLSHPRPAGRTLAP